ncbi:dipeptide/oligopeptide/nickel ABC transporter permease/ATP-binding protein [Subtercola frigoramans]|uniref:Peptide/nickel transport system permease protein n=1 Tax=Subtercola frigoramans TaxID=120298 RepID=A0ABS2L107_9MICO|nr:dipeptide/oligopeptide/nickel ABC transporter permease/ATP-binding protein [Subtercola frigoramans]MBM7470762.1 peptide/nickel transport system permease protein [Subtercola frigoramans]
MTAVVVPETSTEAIATGRLHVSQVLRRPVPLIALIVILLITVAVILAPLIAPYDPLAQDLDNILAGPSAAHLLGTDELGRDIYSRLLYGGQPALLGVLVASVVFAVFGLILGILAGYLGGWTDRVIGSVLDVLMSLPAIVVILAVLAIFSQSIVAAMFVLGLLSSANLARVTRSMCLALREELFVSAATVSGIGPVRIMFRHVLPSLIGLMVVQVALFAGIALAVQTGLGFLGLATPPPAPSWGGMVGEAAQTMSQSGFFLFVTGAVIAVMTLAFGLLGDGIRDLNADLKGRSSGASKILLHAADGGQPVSPEGIVVEVRDYSVAFSTPSGEKKIVDRISFEVERGQIFGIVGESGSGKTVTALSLLGLLPQNGTVTNGHAWLDGQDLATMSEKQYERIRGKEIGLVSQEPMVALDPLFTIGSQLSEVVSRIGDVPRREVRATVVALLESVKLPEPERLMQKYPHELSGGMVQRVAIAMALAGSPTLLLADEPTTALDVTVQAGILDLLRELRDSRGMTVLLVTHDLGVVAEICDSAIVMSQGRIVDSGSIDHIFYDSDHPYTRALIASTPTLEDGAA